MAFIFIFRWETGFSAGGHVRKGFKPFSKPQNSGTNKNHPPPKKKASKNYILEKPEGIINTYVRVTNEQF